MVSTLKQKAQLYQKLFTGFKAGVDPELLIETQILPGLPDKQAILLTRLLGGGKPLSALLGGARLVSPWETRLLSVGEACGRTEQILADLQQHSFDRYLQLTQLKKNLLYPVMILLVAIILLPLPALSANAIGFVPYLLQAAFLLTLLGLFYFIGIEWVFNRPGADAFSPALLKLMKLTGKASFLRLVYETAYLNLLTLCLESGLDASQMLKLLRDCSQDPGYQFQHKVALRHVDEYGRSLSDALSRSGLIQHWLMLSFLNSSEKSGTVHSELRTFIIKKKFELADRVRRRIRAIGKILYLCIVATVISQLLY